MVIVVRSWDRAILLMWVFWFRRPGLLSGLHCIPLRRRANRRALAQIPPKVIHNPQLLGPHTETIGLITPASWVDFFRYVGEPFDGLLYPEYDERSLHENIIPKIMAAKGKYDVHFYPDYKGCEVSEWGPEDEKLPDGMAPFYLKANTGPRWMLGGVLSRPFVTTKQTGATFAISSIESSSTYGGTVFDQPMSFPTSHHCFCVFEGAVRISLSDGSADTLHEGESAFIAADTAFKLEFKSNFCRLWSFASGGGIEQLVQEAGEPYKGFALPNQAPPVDGEKVKRVLSELKITV